MGSKVNKEDLLKNLSVAVKVIGNKKIAYENMNFLKLYAEDGKLWYRAMGDGHELLLQVSDFEGDEKINVEYGRLGNVLKILNDEVDLTLTDVGLEVSDGQANAKLASYMVEGFEEDVQNHDQMAETKEKGYKLSKKKFLETLTYMHGLRNRDAEDEMMEDIYFTEKYTFIFDERYVVRLDNENPFEMVLDGNTSETLIAFLRSSTEEDFYIRQPVPGAIDFVIGDNYYGVNGLNTHLKNIEGAMGRFEAEETVKIGLGNFIRFIELATIFLDDDEEDVVCQISEGEGKILSDTEENASDGTFKAEGVEDVNIGLNAYDVLTIIGGLKGTVKDEISLQLNLTEEQAYFKHDRGDCLLSIIDRG